ncbi:NADH:ubiquinone oxidoreductase subunit 2 (chain N) [Caldisphaera lagunensis DSM 15908]|uniref:NADH:ubiquinone oxidoreductase subunit 2 (Chain N) n=1 Tax=Caldisphaera lagunensis (strain DSM 15908 / JCM 11604 / ANMR 0165 / IC-154) TaxID=1056495 RepID=L0ACK0_CALLD|nr:NADH-quinone oxidoreductase subunit NuoN [Caldisphaera lagunensis]AFZ71144.1 NADH:ubiquinone oxidoreductase subunit 2 (chain N) [Caldisphaera lagunensis DSM 15908]
MWEIGIIEFFLYVTLAASLLAPIFGIKNDKSVWPASIGAIGIGTFFVVSILTFYASLTNYLTFYNGLVIQDSFTALILLGASIASIIYIIAIGNDGLKWSSRPALYSLIPLVLFGLFFLSGATDALMIIASWLLVSVASYVFVSLPDGKESKEASIRYIMVGMIGTLILVFWAAVFAISPRADTNVFLLTSLAPTTKVGLSLAGLSILLIIAALGFKVGLFPFHWWLPSVYGRGDGRGISFVAGVIKLGFIAIITRAIVLMASSINGSSSIASYAALLIAFLAVASMIYGNIAALTSRNFQVILAYSSMAQVGYIFAAIAAAAYFAGNSDMNLLKLALFAVALQSIAYGIAKTPLFAFVGKTKRELSDLHGLLSANPAAAISASILLFSLLGIPPLLGFWGKLYLFLSASGYSVWLVLIALINSGISAVYYIIASRELLSKGENHITVGKGYTAALIISALALLIIGLYAPFLLKSIINIYY